MAVRGSNSLPREFMGLQVNLVQHVATRVGTITLDPRYNDSTADNFSFSTSGDYAPSSASGGNPAYVDLDLSMFTHSVNWYNHTHDTNVGRRNGSDNAISDLNRVSIWAQLGVGDSPHPGYNYSYTHMAILKNHPGAHHQYVTSGPTPNYSEPRTLRDGDLNFANFRVSGQYYGDGAYGGWYCLANYVSNICITATNIRIINLGGNTDARSRLRIIDLVFLIHGQMGNTGI
jgi:hypothetical protein